MNAINDTRLTVKARFIFTYCKNLKKQITTSRDLAQRLGITESTANKGLQELEKLGYLIRTPVRDNLGHLLRTEYDFRE